MESAGSVLRRGACAHNREPTRSHGRALPGATPVSRTKKRTSAERDSSVDGADEGLARFSLEVCDQGSRRPGEPCAIGNYARHYVAHDLRPDPGQVAPTRLILSERDVRILQQKVPELFSGLIDGSRGQDGSRYVVDGSGGIGEECPKTPLGSPVRSPKKVPAAPRLAVRSVRFREDSVDSSPSKDAAGGGALPVAGKRGGHPLLEWLQRPGDSSFGRPKASESVVREVPAAGESRPVHGEREELVRGGFKSTYHRDDSGAPVEVLELLDESDGDELRSLPDSAASDDMCEDDVDTYVPSDGEEVDVDEYLRGGGTESTGRGPSAHALIAGGRMSPRGLVSASYGSPVSEPIAYAKRMVCVPRTSRGAEAKCGCAPGCGAPKRGVAKASQAARRIIERVAAEAEEELI